MSHLQHPIACPSPLRFSEWPQPPNTKSHLRMVIAMAHGPEISSCKKKKACLHCPLLYGELRTINVGLTVSLEEWSIVGKFIFICFYESRAVKHKMKINLSIDCLTTINQPTVKNAPAPPGVSG